MNTECYIEIPADKLRDAVKLAYGMSGPQGLGFLHFQAGGLSDEDTDKIINRERPGWIAVSMDYVHGRSCKFSVYREGERLFIQPSWYDHGDAALEELLDALRVGNPAAEIQRAKAAQRAANEKWERENP
jgi:hypothetical protein